jgi:site-specific recombinase XerD
MKIKNYELLFYRFNDEFGDRDLVSIAADEILSFLTRLTEGNTQTIKRNRIMMELMAKGGMRISEVLKIRPVDVKDRMITLAAPKRAWNQKSFTFPRKSQTD